ncbi:hypothetical protein ACTFIT_010624 [Dictyostelium discoideum]
MQVDTTRNIEFPMYLPSVDNILNFNMEELIKAPNSNFIIMSNQPYQTTSPEIVEDYIIKRGQPFVLTGTTQGWSRSNMFTLDFLSERYSEMELINSPRNNETHTDLQGWRMKDFISYLQVSPEERNPKHLYGKDIACPREWQEYLSHKLQPQYSYKSRFDLVSHLPDYLQPETLLVYIGSNGTYTPGHIDMCGSLSQNLMVSSDQDAFAWWFIVPTEYKDEALKFWGDKGGDVYNESRFIRPIDLLGAPFPIYVFKQRPGDFIFVPPDSVHQVVNCGPGISTKVAWNSISLKSLPISYFSSLPHTRRMAKPELFRIKAIAYYTLRKIMGDVENTNFNTIDVNDVIDIIAPLLEIFHNILQTESILIPKPNYPYCNGETIPFLQPFKYFNGDRIQDRRCDHCNSDIFNRCYHCETCKTDDGQGKDFCFDCVSSGIGCEFHFKVMVLKEFISHSKLKKELSSFYEIYKNLLAHSGRRPKEVDDIITKSTDRVSDECGFLTTATVAYHVVFYSSQKKIKCHRCEKRFKKFSIIFCTNCNARFCEQCVVNTFGQNFQVLMKRNEWECFCCKGLCDCSNCTSNSNSSNHPRILNNNQQLGLPYNNNNNSNNNNNNNINNNNNNNNNNINNNNNNMNNNNSINNNNNNNNNNNINNNNINNNNHHNNNGNNNLNSSYSSLNALSSLSQQQSYGSYDNYNNNNNNNNYNNNNNNNGHIQILKSGRQYDDEQSSSSGSGSSNSTPTKPRPRNGGDDGLMSHFSGNNNNNNNHHNNNNNNNNNHHMMSHHHHNNNNNNNNNNNPTTSSLSSLSTSLSSSSTSTQKPMDVHSKKRPIVLDNDKPKGRPPKNLKEWTSTHKFIISLIELFRSSNNAILGKPNPHYKPIENLPPLVQLYLSQRKAFGGVLWAKTNSCPLLPCIWVKDLSVIPPNTKLLPSLIQGKKIVVLFFGDQDQEEYVGIVGKKSIFSFDEVNQTLLLKCGEVPLAQLEDLFNTTEPEIAMKKDIAAFNYKNQIEEKEEGLYVKQELYNNKKII